MTGSHIGIAIAAGMSALTLGASQIDAQSAPVEWQLRRESVIGGDGPGNATLNYIMKASRGPDGTLLVSQPEAKYLVSYDASGKFIGTLGRSGRGPGEFGDVTTWGWRRDSVWVYDRMLRRLTILARDGRFLRDTSRVIGATPDEGFVALLSNGAVLISQHDYTAIGRRTAPMGTQMPLSFRIERPDGTRGPEIGPFRMVTSSTMVETGNGASYSVSWLWHDNPLIGVSPNGEHVVVVETPHPSTSTGSFRVHRYAPTGARSSSTTRDFEAQRVTKALQDSVDRLTQTFVRGRLTVDMVNKEMQRAPKAPQWLRAFDRMVVLNDGTLWLRGAANSQRWFAVQTNDQIIAEVRVPSRGLVLDGDGQSLWVSVLDDMDVPSIVRYRIDRR